MKALYFRSVSKIKFLLFIFSIFSFVNKSEAQSTCNAHFSHYSLTSNADSVHFYPADMHASHYSWTFGDGSTSTNHDPWHLYAQPGNYLACLIITDSTGATCDFCDSVHVGNPPPVCNAHFNHYSSTSNADSVHFYPVLTGATHYTWNFGDGTHSTNQDPWHLYSQPGNYLACLIVTTSTGATCDFCDSVHVGNPPPVCNAHFSHYSLTSNADSVHFYPVLTGATHYTWNFGDGTHSTNQDPWHLYSQPGNYLACLIVTTSTGATCDFCDSVHVGNPPPVCNAHFNHYSLTSNADSVHFYPADMHASHYSWTFGDGSTSTNHDPWHLYAQPGNYLACLIITDSAGATCDFCDSVHVGNPPPVCNAHFNHYSSTSNADSVHFYPVMTGATHYTWNFGDGTHSTNQDPWHLYSQPGNYLACLVVTTSTGATCDFCDSIHVGNPPPVCNAHFSHYSLTSNADSVHFYPADMHASHYSWTFGDGSTSTNHDPWHLYAQPGNYLACLIITDSAGATCDFCDSVHVGNPPPVCNAHFNHYSSTSNADSVHFYPVMTGATHYTWNFGDGTHSTNQDPWHLYSLAGNYFVCLVVTTSTGTTCDFCDSVHVGNPPPLCNAHFSHYSLPSNADSIHFYPAATGSVHYLWDFDDGTSSTSLDPWHLFSQPGNYHICLIVTDTITGVSCDWCDNIVVTSFHSGSSFSINPNPANRIASVSLINISDPVEIRIFDIAGRLIYERENLTDSNFDIDTESFLDGIYYYTVRNSSDVISEGKLMIVH